MKKRKSKSWSMAYCGMAAALCVALMLLGTIIPIAMFIAPAVASFLIATVCMECGITMAWTAYAAVSLLSIFVTFDKEAALIFILFFGHYPILRQQLEKLPGKALVWLGKCLTAGICFAADYYATIYVLGLKELAQEFAGLGRYALPVISLLLLGMFLCYDYALGGMLLFYRNWFKPKILGRSK